MRQDIDISDFTKGELSPKLKGRVDYKGYFSGCDTLLNMVVLPQGGVTRKPGNLLAGLAKDQSDVPRAVRILRFVFSTVQAYTLEFSNQNVRIYMNGGVVLNGGIPVDVMLPYLTADLAVLKFTQSADTLYVCHPNYPPATLSRSSHTNWTYNASAFQDGPYLDVNRTDTTLSPSGTSGNIIVTASSVVGINPTPTSTGQGFLVGDIGRIIRLQLFSLWAWVKITGWISATQVNAQVQGVVNNGAYEAIDGAQWQANKRYPTGAVVSNTTDDSGGLKTRYYIAIAGGVSAGPNGPSGTGNNIIDGSVTWSMAGPLNGTEFMQNTTYVPGDIVHNASNGNYYVCTLGGDVGGGPNAPTGTGTGIVAKHAVFEFVAPFTFPTTTKFWQMGKWGGANGFPMLPIFWQQRLALLGTPNEPSACEASNTADFTNMSPTNAQGTVLATSALSLRILDDQVEDVRWVIAAGSSVAMQLGIGTGAGEHVVQPATNSLGLSNTNVQTYPETRIGSAPNVGAVRIGKSVIFTNRSGRKVYDWIWQWAINGYAAIERTVDSEHITAPNPKSLQGIAVPFAYQQQPYGIIWFALGDGSPRGMTYLPEQNVVAWHRHQLGGQYYGGPPFVESICEIPSPDGSYNQLWLCVLRTVNGVVTRTIEVMAPYFDGQPQDQACFMDAAISSPLTFPAATCTPSAMSGQGVVFTASAPVFAGTLNNVIRLNNGVAIIRAVTDNQHVIADWMLPATSLKPALANAWSCTAQADHFTGLDYLNGETVQIYGDGADMGTALVAAGRVNLPAGQTASFATIGLPAPYDVVTMPWAPERAVPLSPTGKMKKINHLYLRVHETLGFVFGRKKTDPVTNAVTHPSEAALERYSTAPLGWAPSLFSGQMRVPLKGGTDQETQIEISGSGPFPCTVLAIAAAADVGAE